MPRPSPLLPCRRAFPCSPPLTACETRIHDTSYPSGGHRLVGPAWAFDLNRLRKFRASAFGTLRRADSLRLGSNLPGSGARAGRSGIGAFQFPGRCPHHCLKMPHTLACEALLDPHVDLLLLRTPAVDPALREVLE